MATPLLNLLKKQAVKVTHPTLAELAREILTCKFPKFSLCASESRLRTSLNVVSYELKLTHSKLTFKFCFAPKTIGSSGVLEGLNIHMQYTTVKVPFASGPIVVYKSDLLKIDYTLAVEA
jgi:hypothetical protein